MPRVQARSVAIVVGAVLAASLLVWPIAEMAFEDDWCFAWSACQMAAGHGFKYNYAAMPLIPQLLWGGLLVRIFGFSFTLLRLSTLPWSAGCAVMAYLVGRRCGLGQRWAVFASLMLCLSPIVLPLETSFMTDVPALCLLLLSLWCLMRCAAELSLGWLAIAAAVGLLAGAQRQTGWVAPLAVLPLIAILGRAKPGFAIAAVAAWLLVLAGAVGVQVWFNAQPYIVHEPPASRYVNLALQHPANIATGLVASILTTLLLALPAAFPAAIGWVLPLRGPRQAWLWRSTVGAAALVVIALAVPFLRVRLIEPWMGNDLTIRGVLGHMELSGHRPISRPLVASAILSGACWLVAALLAARALAGAARWRHANLRAAAGQLPAARELAVLGIFAAALGVLICIRATEVLVFDRYLIPWMFCAGIFLLRFLQEVGRVWQSRLAWTILGFYTLYALAITSDNLALARARAAAVARLRAAGVAATAIAAGHEYDMWTQLQTDGYINDLQITNPPVHDPRYIVTPAMKPIYRVEFGSGYDTHASPLGSIRYFSPLPPFDRTIYIDEYDDSWKAYVASVPALPSSCDYEQFHPE